MIIDNIKLIDGSIQNAVVESGTALPASDLVPGRIFFLREVQGPNAIGLYIYAGAEWILFSSSEYVDSRIAEIVGTAPETLNSLSELATALGEDPDFILTINDKIDTETTRAQAAESALSSSLTAETTRATGAESAIQSNVDSEVAARQASDSNLQTQIDNEVTARSGADTSFQEQIDSEIATRQAADNTKVNKSGDTLTGHLTLHANPTAALHASTKGYVDSLISSTGSDVSNESSRAQAAEAALQSDIDDEVSRAQLAETNLSNAISNEVARAGSAESSLQTQLDSEVNERQSSDVTLQSAIDSETNSRTTADTNLQNQINDADAAIASEVTARTNAVTSLQGQIDDADAAIASEVTARTSSDTNLQNQINDADAAIASEATARANAVTNLQGQIDDADAAIASEVTARTNAVTNLQGQIDDADAAIASEVTARTNAVTSLQGQIDDADAAISSEATARSNADMNLQGQIDDADAAIAAHASDYSKHLTSAQNSLLDGIAGTISSAEINRLDGVTGNIQSQLNSKVNSSLVGAANGLATLDTNGFVPAAQLPAFVDDVLEVSSLPASGNTGVIYVRTSDNTVWRWSGSSYIEINQSVGSADTAVKLANPRTISLSGEVTGSTTFDGSSNVTIDVDFAGSNTLQTQLNATNAALDAEETTRANAVTSLQNQIDAEESARIAVDNAKLDKSGGTVSGNLTVSGIATFTGSKLSMGEGLEFADDNGYFDNGGYQDARIMRMVDVNGTGGNVDGGLIITSYTQTDGVEQELVRVRNSQFQYKGNDIYHAGNDGSGSNLDADKLDGLHASQFLRADANDTMTQFLSLSKAPTSGAHAANKSYVDGRINSVESNYTKRFVANVAANHTVPSSQKAKNHDNVVFVDTSSAARTITLPASPAVGCKVSIIDVAGTFGSNAATVARNGQLIMGIADNMLINTNNASATLIYSGSAKGWRLVY